MRCLYCGEPLSLLRKLTGKAEFCSEAHREAYQEEFNSLALQRLAYQPKQSRSAEPAPPMVIPAAMDLNESFAGLPFPDEPEEFELPVFDSPIFARRDPPDDEAVAPAPLWALLSMASPAAASGDAGQGFEVSIELADYPRPCLMTNGVFQGTVSGTVPFGTYADLPEPIDEAIGDMTVEPELWSLVSAQGWELPPCRLTAPGGEIARYETLLDLPGHPSPADCENAQGTLAMPDAERFAVPVCQALPSTKPVVTRALATLSPFRVEPEPHAGWDGGAESPELDWEAWPPAAAAPVNGIHLSPERIPQFHGESFPCFFPGTLAAGPFEDLEIETAFHAFDAVSSSFVPQFRGPARPEAVPVLLAAPAARLEDFGWDMPAAAGGSDESLDTAAQPFLMCSSPDSLWTVPAPSAPADRLPPVAGLFPGVEIDLATQDSANAQGVDSAAEHLSWATAPPELLVSADDAPVRERATVLAGPLPVADWGADLGTDSQPPVTADWACFPACAAPHWASVVLVDTAFSDRSPALAGLDAIAEFSAASPEDQEFDEPAAEAIAEWHRVSLPLPAPRLPRISGLAGSSSLTRVRVKDFSWPDFAAGCDSLFAPDQPFRFHEIPFPQRGTTDLVVGDVLQGDVIGGLRLRFSDDRFDHILRPGLDPTAVAEWLNQSGTAPSVWPAIPPVAEGAPRVEAPPAAPSPKPSGSKPADAPSFWQQAARAMHEGEQQVPPAPQPKVQVPPPTPVSQPPKPASEGKPVTAVPVETQPLTGTEVARVAPPQLPTPHVSDEPLRNRDPHQPPANEGPQFEWRRDQPHQQQPPAGGSSISVNTTIIVEGNAGSGVVVENAVRISLGDRGNKRKGDAVEKFTDGEDMESERIQIAAPEGFPEFVPAPVELRPLRQPLAPLADSIQWPKFSVAPMRRRIAFGPVKNGLFGMASPQPAAKTPPEAKPMPPKKSVGGFLFKKLTNS